MEVVEIIYIVGFAWELFRTTQKQGLRAYLYDWWLCYMAIMVSCFTISGIARLVSVAIGIAEVDLKRKMEKTSAQHPNMWILLHIGFIHNSLQGDEYKNEARMFWPSDDPALVAEGFFCIAVILAFVRLLYIFQVSQVSSLRPVVIRET